MMRLCEKTMPKYILPLLLIAFLAGACNTPTSNATPADTPAVPVSPTHSQASAEATPTEAQTLVGSVNGEGITEASYLLNLAQFEAALSADGNLLAEGQTASQRVLGDLVNRMLLAQGARAEGFSLDDATVDVRINALAEQMGGAEALTAWLVANGYDAIRFRAELRLEIEAGWMREQIMASVPHSAEQILARQVFFYDAFSAQRILGQLEGGTPFQQVVNNNDPQDLGYLGWFPRGYLLLPEVEAAAFALQPGQLSAVIESAIGYHILEIIDRQADRPLSPDARVTLGLAALESWLAEERAASSIELSIP
jgi:peptidyl-prolyl cis-trans isomerase C